MTACVLLLLLLLRGVVMMVAGRSVVVAVVAAAVVRTCARVKVFTLVLALEPTVGAETAQDGLIARLARRRARLAGARVGREGLMGRRARVALSGRAVRLLMHSARTTTGTAAEQDRLVDGELLTMLVEVPGIWRRVMGVQMRATRRAVVARTGGDAT